MQLSNNGIKWFEPEPYTTFKSWQVSDGEGYKFVYVKFKDAAGNWSQPYFDIIFLKNYLNPVSKITASVRSGYYIVKVQFSGSNSYDPDGGRIVSYRWNFGDKRTSNQMNPPAHYFVNTSKKTAYYIVTLTVTDDRGLTATSGALIIVYPRKK
jgi:PKD repeat protein